jgi:hypothetical protein
MSDEIRAAQQVVDLAIDDPHMTDTGRIALLLHTCQRLLVSMAAERKRAETAEQLAEKYAAQRQADAKTMFEQFDLQQARIDALLQRTGFLEASCAALRQGLEPLAALYTGELTASWTDDTGDYFYVTIGAVRRARAALATNAGEAVLAELNAARVLIAYVRSIDESGDCGRIFEDALAAYEAARKASAP